jgi:hypothetical protein
VFFELRSCITASEVEIRLRNPFGQAMLDWMARGRKERSTEKTVGAGKMTRRKPIADYTKIDLMIQARIPSLKISADLDICQDSVTRRARVLGVTLKSVTEFKLEQEYDKIKALIASGVTVKEACRLCDVKYFTFNKYDKQIRGIKSKSKVLSAEEIKENEQLMIERNRLYNRHFFNITFGKTA